MTQEDHGTKSLGGRKMPATGLVSWSSCCLLAAALPIKDRIVIEGGTYDCCGTCVMVPALFAGVRFCKGKPHVFFSCTQTTDRVQLRNFSNRMFMEDIPAKNYITEFTDWEKVFRFSHCSQKADLTKRLLPVQRQMEHSFI